LIITEDKSFEVREVTGFVRAAEITTYNHKKGSLAMVWATFLFFKTNFLYVGVIVCLSVLNIGAAERII